MDDEVDVDEVDDDMDDEVDVDEVNDDELQEGEDTPNEDNSD